MILVDYISHMGTDDSVCDAARVSMDKQAAQFTPDQNRKLIQYLADHGHWSPFAHTSVSFRFKAPIFIARQLQKHQVGFAWNEVSRRYVSSTPHFWIPRSLRKAAPNVKQGSSSEESELSDAFIDKWTSLTAVSNAVYKEMLASGICPEQARAILPQSMITEWIWTGSLYAWSRMYNQRIDPHAQVEVQEYAVRVDHLCSIYFPHSWAALTKEQH